MTGPEHYRRAERLLEQAYTEDCDSPYHRHLLSTAHVHATLALVAACASPCPGPSSSSRHHREVI